LQAVIIAVGIISHRGGYTGDPIPGRDIIFGSERVNRKNHEHAIDF
jgi:hypothetical protein